jgi:hypothetical protein
MADLKSPAEIEAQRDGWNGHKAGRPIHDRPNYLTDLEREAHAKGWQSREVAIELGVVEEFDAKHS